MRMINSSEITSGKATYLPKQSALLGSQVSSVYGDRGDEQAPFLHCNSTAQLWNCFIGNSWTMHEPYIRPP